MWEPFLKKMSTPLWNWAPDPLMNHDRLHLSPRHIMMMIWSANKHASHYTTAVASTAKKWTLIISVVSDTLDSSGMPGVMSSMGVSMGGHSPPDIKPDISSLASAHGGYYGFGPIGIPGMATSTQPSPGPLQMHSPTSSMGSPSMTCLSPTGPSSSPGLPHSSSNPKTCAICGDRASGKHYGVHR